MAAQETTSWSNWQQTVEQWIDELQKAMSLNNVERIVTLAFQLNTFARTVEEIAVEKRIELSMEATAKLQCIYMLFDEVQLLASGCRSRLRK